MEGGDCAQTHLWELDEDFHTTRKKEANNQLRDDILTRINIPRKGDQLKQEVDDESTDSDNGDSTGFKFDVLLDPECGYACEKDIGWFDIGQSPAPWDETRRPYDQILKYEDLVLTESEKGGTLSGMIVSTGLSILDTIPVLDGHALTKLQLSDKGLKNIQILDTYKYLQYLDISYNSIEDLSPLEQSTYLMVLDASNNLINHFKPNPTPWFLTYLNLSHNKFESVPDVSSMWSLKHLNLSDNQIRKIEGISNLNYLEYLNLSHNIIQVIENISGVPLVTLDLSWNKITHCIESAEDDSGLKNITTLLRLDVSHNYIKNMSNLNCINPTSLRHLNIAFNEFDNVNSFDDLKRFKALRYLRLEGNTIIHELPELVKSIMHLLPQLDYINGNKLTKPERLIAYSMWNSDAIVHEMKKYCYDLLYSNVEPPDYGVETPKHLDYHVPIVILVGPSGTRKHKLAEYIAERYPQYVKVPMIHTTMHPYTNHHDISEEFEAMNLCHVSEPEFKQMWNTGKLLIVHSDLGDLFGLSREELDDDGRVFLIPLNMGPALSLTWKGLNTSLVLVRPANEDEYSLLLQRYIASKLSIHKERDALKEVIESEQLQPKESIIEEEAEEQGSKLSNDESTIAENEPSQRKFGRSKLSSSKGSLMSESLRGKSSIKSLKSKTSAPSRDTIIESITKSMDMDYDSLEFKFEEDYPSWCDDSTEDEVVEEEVQTETKKVQYLDTLKMCLGEKENARNLYGVYYEEQKTYYEEISEHWFTQTVVVEDLDLAMKKLLPLLVEKYNASLKVPETKREKDVLYDVLVKPRLDEMMEILADRGVTSRLESMEDEKGSMDVSSSELTKDTLSMPFFSKSTSSLNVTPSTSLTEYGSEEIQLEDPYQYWAPQTSPSRPSTPSSVLHILAKDSIAKAGYDILDQDKIIKYS